MQNYDDKIDGFSQEENELLLQAYNAQLNQVTENKSFALVEDKANSICAFDEQNFRYVPTENKVVRREDSDNYYVAPQVEYVGLTTNERSALNDLINDLKQYFNDDFNLSDFCDNESRREIDRPFFYFVSKTRMLSKIVSLVCSIFDKAKRNTEVNDLLGALIRVADKINTKS